ncbi:MAG: flagellar hook-length control protein FliK [Methylobacter sp.]|uniref:Flagellar hook-length control protein FliK n=1 Tax=Candidatus Methylobacter titanis TaxID=3053457 RepID=A0AA43Q6M6_9GAMM|nr:flagellar hook-length control protein FliK [Candidatus Methylobacter titanis]
MDINSPINPKAMFGANRPLENTLNLKVGQKLDAKVISADIQAAKNVITLAVGNKDITVQSNQPITTNSGQNLKIQVTQTIPVVEFKILNSSPELAELRLKLIAASGQEPVRPTAAEKQDSATLSSPAKQPLDAKIIGITGNKIQLQIFTPSTTDMGNKQVGLITIDRSQLTHAPQNLKIGQNLNLEMLKAGTTAEFKVISASNAISEAKIAEFIKQFLPRHEASPLFLNQLIKDLPKLMNNESVPKVLKDIAAKIIQNLPPKEQLITSQGLKQAIANSGLFLEAKLPPAMAQAELIKELPQLIKNETVPQSLQRIAAEILQNLTQKEPLLNSPSATTAKQLSEAELLTLKLNIAEVPKADALGNEDFKANLLKFIQALKQELTSQAAQQINQADLDLLKNLQNKTENTVAKLVLDQLMSLPKEDNPKQLWLIDIPFIDRQQAETVKIEIQQDKENKQPSGSSDWSVNITITPPELGTIHCRVSYQNDVINTYFNSQQTQTTQLIKHNLDYLKNQLEESGLTTGHMVAHNGSQNKQATHQLAGKKLFDDNA